MAEMALVELLGMWISLAKDGLVMVVKVVELM